MSLLEKTKGREGFMPKLRSNFDDLFDLDRFFDEPGLRLSRINKVPATNIRETKDEYMVEVAVPGLKKNDFTVNVEHNMLEIKVEKEVDKTDENENFTRREYDYTAFYRSFNIPEDVKAEEIKAEYKEGILKVKLPKREETKGMPPKKISVN